MSTRKPSQYVRLRQFLEFVHRTRCTTNEALRLKWADIDANIIRLRHERRPVLFWLDPVAIRLLKAIRESEPPSAHVFAHVRMMTTDKAQLNVFGGQSDHKERQVLHRVRSGFRQYQTST